MLLKLPHPQKFRAFCVKSLSNSVSESSSAESWNPSGPCSLTVQYLSSFGRVHVVLTGWQLQADPMWERREPCHLRQRPTGFAHAAWGFEESSIHSEALPSRLALSLGMVPLSLRLCWPQALALAVPRTHGLGPDCSSCGSSFQMGRGGASGVRERVPASVSTQQWLPGDLQVVKGQQGKGLRKGMERSKIRAGGQRRQWGKEAARPIRPSPPHQVIPEGHQGANLPTNPPNSGLSGQLGPVLAFVLGAEGVERGH